MISRSQAKRLLARFDKFKYAVLDFSGIDDIGQVFADEIFRVFVNSHPEIEISYIEANKSIKNMIEHVSANR
ncbi:MAG: STAS-like domain-containing protein [Succinivibrio sp.]|nr:STAS-like domain-containing protein [Succinivibrio sp.]